MPVNMSGAEYRRFLNADWGADAYWEDYILTVDGVTPEDSDEADGLIKDGSLVTITGGFIVPDANNYAVEKNIDAEKFARKWLKEQTTVSLMIDVDKASLDAVKAAIGAIRGAKIL